MRDNVHLSHTSLIASI